MITKNICLPLLLSTSLYAGPTQQEKQLLKDAVFNNDLKTTQQLLPKVDNINEIRFADHNASLLHIAAWLGYTDVVRELLKHPSIDHNCKDARGITPFHTAIIAISKDTPENQPHFKAFAEIMNHPKIDFNATTHEGENALHIALNLQWKDPILKLCMFIYLCRGADLTTPKKVNINHKNNMGIAPAFITFVPTNSYEIRELFFKQDELDITQTCNNGITLLHLATANNEREFVQKCIDKKADVNAIAYIDPKDPKRKITALQIARDNKYLELVRLLEQAGGITYENDTSK